MQPAVADNKDFAAEDEHTSGAGTMQDLATFCFCESNTHLKDGQKNMLGHMLLAMSSVTRNAPALTSTVIKRFFEGEGKSVC